MASAVEKTFKCIEALSRSPMGLTVSEVAQVAGFSRPAATRLLESLTTDSIIVRDPQSKRYRLGLRLYEWSNLAVQASTPVNIARREFIKLATEIRRECNLLVLEDLDAVLVERAEDVDGIPVRVATPLALYRLKHATVRAKDRQDAAALRERFQLEADDEP